MITQSPCKDCCDREIGCHSTCDKYLKYLDDKDAENKVRKDFLRSHNEHVSYMRDQKAKRERAGR